MKAKVSKCQYGGKFIGHVVQRDMQSKLQSGLSLKMYKDH